MRDTVFSVATPEGIELHLRVAGPVPRALAWRLDLLWRLALLVALAIGLGSLKEVGVGLWLLTWFALEWLVPAWFAARLGGATPGKRALGLKVVRDAGAPAPLAAALPRNVDSVVNFLNYFYLVGVLSMVAKVVF